MKEYLILLLLLQIEGYSTNNYRILSISSNIIQVMSNVIISVKVPHISIEKYTTYKLERNNFVHKE